MQNYYSKSLLSDEVKEENVYFLKSNTLMNMHALSNMNYDDYTNRMKQFKEFCHKNGYATHDIDSDKLLSLEKNSILVALDMMALSEEEMRSLESFVQNGGKLLFNYTSGFIGPTMKNNEKNLVSRITGLTTNEDFSTVKFDSNSTSFLSMRLMSPLAKYLPRGKSLDLTLYDYIPLFVTPEGLEADAYATNWSQDTYSKIPQNRVLNKNESGLLWHGNNAKGKWIYFSFPSYVFMDSSKYMYIELFRAMLEKLNNDIDIVPYTYIDALNAVFVSEDTEYKYENLEQFYNVAIKHSFPVTVFCVAGLAKEHQELMKKISKNKFIEIGSHSYTHEKIIGQSNEVYEKETLGAKKYLDELTQQDVIGFRPPREEIDDKMIDYLQRGGYKYMVSNGSDLLAPYYMHDTIVIPRHGTDDYAYFINLDWNTDQILNEMKKQANMITGLNGIYTMSTHSHLMGLGSNIKIIDNFFEYINNQKEMTPMNGEMLYKRIKQKLNLQLETKVTLKKIVVNIANNNETEVENMHYDIHVNSDIEITGVESEIIGIKTTIKKVGLGRYILKISSLQPKSQTVLFMNYVKTR
ncbi:polysaccharide deacetylase family protein [bacterium]|nr:polysaccharide deacetylase family protein [bacterium]